ncbi:MAG TPA: hypothetical protein DIW81_29930 [Planctomycetaceae bacterium]|nr:hypothetical protein [Rubinisphaera sp.]HCS55760.1 hypothetical protein [Planctomycetaceae bacterium]
MKNPAEEWENRVNSYAWHNRIDAQIISTWQSGACRAGTLVASRGGFRLLAVCDSNYAVRFLRM